MAWRIVVTPNGRYARFSDIVDNFCAYNMNREEAVEDCIEQGLHPEQAEAKVQRAEADLGRYLKELHTIEVIHGIDERNLTEDMILNGDTDEAATH